MNIFKKILIISLLTLLGANFSFAQERGGYICKDGVCGNTVFTDQALQQVPRPQQPIQPVGGGLAQPQIKCKCGVCQPEGYMGGNGIFINSYKKKRVPLGSALLYFFR